MSKKIKIKKDEDFIYYPSLDDEHFYKNIYTKKEFHNNKILKQTKNIQELCNPSAFTLLPQQKFLKNFISTETPYNGVLVFWSVGVGKSCGAITIAEQFKEYMKKYNKRALIILKKSIRKGFEEQIHDIKKEKVKQDDVVQCTDETYSLTSDDKYLTFDQKKRKIQRMVRQNYEFVGYEQFANDVKRHTKWNGEINDLTPEIKKMIENKYSNRVIIIDEVHHINVKVASDVNIKKVPPILKTIIKYSKNVKLVLMSATPMYDKPEEIIYLLNLLLLNDNRKEIKASDIFTADGNLKPNGDKILSEASKGYISYLRGENPITFPLRLYSQNSVVPKSIKYDIRGQILTPDEKIRYLKLNLCNMSEYQYKYYKDVLKNVDSKNINNINNNNGENFNNKKNIGLNSLIYISNIIFPTKSNKITFAKHGFSTTDDGIAAFQKITKSINSKKRIIYKYQNHSLINKGTKDETSFLNINHIEKYSSKFYNALKNILNSKGVIFIYSRYIPAGVLPFSLALEQNGIRRYEDSSGDKQLLEYNTNNNGGGGKTNPICFLCGKFASDNIHNPINNNYHKWYPAQYILLTGKKELTKIEINKAKNIINSDDNKNGEKVKIIIGNEAISEGIDFHRIRQVHILEPWYNISSLEQIIGRAIRSCSHKALEEKNRNVEIFLYSSAPPSNSSLKDKETETIDEKYYRLSESKDIKIKNVEHILKKSAVDCLLNKNGNIYSYDKKLLIETSSGHEIKHNIKDEPYSRECDYKKNCNYKCNWEVDDNKNLKINEDTYNLIFAKDDIMIAKKYIKNMYRKDIIFDLDVIINNIVKKNSSIKNIYIYKALDEIVKNKEIVYDKFNREGHLIYKGKYYIYQPKEITDESIPLYYRNIPIKTKIKDLQIINYIKENEFNKNSNLIDNIIDEIKVNIKQYGKILELAIRQNNININNSFFAILGMSLDRIKENNIIYLIKNVINKHNQKNTLDDLEKKILEYYVDNLFLEELTTNKDKKLKSNIFGFKYHNKYYCINNNSWVLCNDNIRKKIELLNKKIMVREEKPKNILTGLLIYNKKNQTNFQIVDKSKHKEALTIEEKKSQRVKITGRTCDTFNISILADIQKRLNMNISGGKVKKDMLCVEIEFYFRYKDNTDKNKKWLINEVKN